LLNALPDRDLHLLLSGATVINLHHGLRLYREGGPVDWLYFPTHGVVSILAGTSDKGDIEAATVGREGAAGIDVIFGVSRALGHTVIQVAGEGIVIAAPQFLELMRRRAQFSLS
jgi:CRP-like cAMP-binding protein